VITAPEKVRVISIVRNFEVFLRFFTPQTFGIPMSHFIVMEKREVVILVPVTQENPGPEFLWQVNFRDDNLIRVFSVLAVNALDEISEDSKHITGKMFFDSV